MDYDARLNKQLMPAATKPKWDELLIHVRPPREMVQAKEFLLTAPEPGKFDLEASFYEPQKKDEAAKTVNLHVLARIKQPKNAPK